MTDAPHPLSVWVILVIGGLLLVMAVVIDVKFSNLDQRIRALEQKP